MSEFVIKFKLDCPERQINNDADTLSMILRPLIVGHGFFPSSLESGNIIKQW